MNIDVRRYISKIYIIKMVNRKEIRCYVKPEVKQRLKDEAKSKGISFGNYISLKLSNYEIVPKVN